MLHRITEAALLVASLATTVTSFSTEPLHAATPTHVHSSQFPNSRLRSLKYAFDSSPSDAETYIDIPTFIASPVLAQVYPALIAHKAKYGNPNIPLGSSDGKKCSTLRRLHFKNKLSEEETAFLTELGFRFHSFEDVYYENDFDEMLEKLMAYHEEFQTYQIPKKYELDPELGAWVTMLRRLHEKNEVPQIQIDKLDAVGFEWISTRKCGSAFMAAYRDALSQLTSLAESGGDVGEFLHENTEMVKWIDAQRLANENGNLPPSRVQYMNDLPGIDWKNLSSWA